MYTPTENSRLVCGLATLDDLAVTEPGDPKHLGEAEGAITTNRDARGQTNGQVTLM